MLTNVATVYRKWQRPAWSLRADGNQQDWFGTSAGVQSKSVALVKSNQILRAFKEFLQRFLWLYVNVRRCRSTSMYLLSSYFSTLNILSPVLIALLDISIQPVDEICITTMYTIQITNTFCVCCCSRLKSLVCMCVKLYFCLFFRA